MCDLEGISISLSFLFNFLPSVLTGAALLIQMGMLSWGIKLSATGQGWERHRGLGSHRPPSTTT